MTRVGVLLSVSLFFIGASHSVAQKNFTFRHFNESDGLSSNFVEAVSQSSTGHLIVAGKDGLDRFGGRNFRKLQIDTGSLAHVTSLARAEGELCFGLFNGNIGRIMGSGDIMEIQTGIHGQIKYVHQDNKDGIWGFSRSGLVFWLNGADTIRFDMAEQDILINTVVPYKHKEFVIGSNDGLRLVRFENDGEFRLLQKIDGVPDMKITAIKYDSDADMLWVGTEDEGLYRVFSPFSDKQVLELFRLNNGASVDAVQAIFTDNVGKVWIGTFGNGLLRIEFYGADKAKFITQRFTENVDEQYLIRDIFQDAENNIWIATFGGGLIQIVENVFHQPFDENWLRKQSITQFFRDSKSNVWLGIDKGIFKTSEYDDKSKFEYHHIGGNEVTAITEDGLGKIWVGTKNSGLYLRSVWGGQFRQIILNKGKLANAINSITPAKNGVYVSTKSGLFHLSGSGQIIDQLSTIDGLPHNNVKYCFEDSVGRLWVACAGNRVSFVWENEVRFIETESDQGIFGVNHILQDNKGRLWFATLGQGIHILDNGNTHLMDERHGLPSNYCYQMALNNDGNVWVSHQKSITQISPEIKIANIIERAAITPVENSMITYLFKDMEDNIWISSTHGVVKFNPAIDKDAKSIPQLSICNMQLFDKDIAMTGEMELPYKKYKVTFILAGISLRDPDHIRYKWQLTGHQNYWSEAQVSNIISVPLEDGVYELRVIASKNGGEWTPEPVTYSFSIEPPVWRRWWFYGLMGMVLIGTIIGFVRYRTYLLLKEKADLERIVGERTIEIQKQNTEIEQSRDEIAKYAKDMTDSIKYARRIQKAIFPTLEAVKKILPGSFIFYRSKDLVSGDFYYAEKIGSKRVFCAVDCTGHGVPGGFMSIVASNLLQQATNQLGLTKPSEILEFLNLGVTNTLHQTYEESSIKDGMDISICCWDEDANIVEFAGAYNPLYLFRDGELIEVKGDRFPVGAFIGEEIKKFKNHRIEVKKGDMLYLFSDGFADQFGGPEGKKFKIRRFKRMLFQIHRFSEEEQLKMVQQKFENWRGNLEQVDDIVILGVRIT